jgi:energy-converting hydrogenase B subunit Q
MNALGISLEAEDRAGLLRDVAAVVADAGGNIEGILLKNGPIVRLTFDISGLRQPELLLPQLAKIPAVTRVESVSSATTVFGKRVIVIGGGAQVAQVVIGAVGEADRHNLRGERISVDTIALVGEENLAEAVRAVARLPRASILVLAGSLMGGAISTAIDQLRAETGIPVISLNMAGSVPKHADLVVSDPVQAGVMAVMAIADTAKFDISRLENQAF